jgi:hypothetical protein
VTFFVREPTDIFVHLQLGAGRAIRARVGSVEAEKMLDDGVRELTDALKCGVEVFVDNLPDPQ